MPRCKCELNLGWTALECPSHELKPMQVVAERTLRKTVYRKIRRLTFVLALSAWPPLESERKYDLEGHPLGRSEK
jgi:hypothetical protein